MLKDLSQRQKFDTLKDWMPSIIESVKKDLKNEHLKKDWMFAKKYFPSVNLNKITSEELTAGYINAIAQEEKGEEIAEFISNCWLIKNGDLYHYFEEELKRINPDFQNIEKLDAAQSEKISKGAIEQFGAYKTYLFSVLNSVAFSDKDLEHLKSQAKHEFARKEEEKSQIIENQGVETLKESYELKIARMTDKYEKKISGLQKKYIQDIEAFKKQISALQAKIAKQ